MTLYLTSVALIKNNLGADYPELNDASIEAMAVKAEAYVYYYTGIAPSVTNPNGITITYSGAGTTVTLDIADDTLTLTVDSTPTAIDLTATANNTLTKLVAVIDAVADFSCALLQQGQMVAQHQ